MTKTEITAIQNEVNQFSFTSVIHKGNYTIGQSWKEREAFIRCNEDCCTLCEKCGCAVPADKKRTGYRLMYVSHGTHAMDFCDGMHIVPDDSWNDIPVLFLFENPSVQYGNLYGEAIEAGEGKCPAQKWYWLHDGYDKDDSLTYPKYYGQGRYGVMVASLIKTFRLRNAYMTNFVKCAMNDTDGKHYLSTTEYNEDCISTCFNNILLKEIEILTNHFQQEIIVFAFSHRVYDLTQKYFGEENTLRGKYSLCLMPHPANRLANEYRKYVLFSKVYKTLTNKGVDCESALKEFLENDKSTNVISIRFREENRNELIERFKGEVEIRNKKISAVGTGTITLLPTELKCRFKLPEGVFEFGFVSNADGAFWIWDGNRRCFLVTAEEVSAKFGKLFQIFRDYISQLSQG